jgi:hypothetical protein
MVNGKASAGEIAAKFAQIGDMLPMLDQLVAQGYVALPGAAGAPPAARPSIGPAVGLADLKRAQVELSMHLRNVLGPDADAVTARIEACKTIEELRAFFVAQREMLDEWLGKSKSAAFWAKAAPYLG